MVKLILFLPVILLLSCNNNPVQEGPDSAETQNSVVQKKHFLKRASYKIEYYDNWKIDATTDNHDIDSYVTLYSPTEEGFVSIFIFNQPINVKEHIDEQVEAHLNKTIKNGKVNYINHWGKYSGYGATIEGKISGIFKGIIKVFAYSNKEYSFLIASQLIYTAKEEDEPGLKLIESSFRLTE